MKFPLKIMLLMSDEEHWHRKRQFQWSVFLFPVRWRWKFSVKWIVLFTKSGHWTRDVSVNRLWILRASWLSPLPSPEGFRPKPLGISKTRAFDVVSNTQRSASAGPRLVSSSASSIFLVSLVTSVYRLGSFKLFFFNLFFALEGTFHHLTCKTK